MKKSTKQLLNKCVNTRAAIEVLGAFINNPKLIHQYRLVQTDFTEGFHRLIFAAINNLVESGIEIIDAVAIDEYLSHYETQYAVFQKHHGIDFVQTITDAALGDNIQYYYEQLKKFALLRSYIENGIDVSDYFDPAEIEPDVIEAKRERLDRESLSEIITHFRKKQLKATASFTISENRDSKKAGVGGLEQKERWKKSTAWGLGFSSAYLTTIFHGMRPKVYTVKSAGTGVGKTRTALADLAYACTPYYYNKNSDTWARNPNGLNNGALYIGTEMELLEEIDPILWAYIADVPQDHIKYNEYKHGEEERVEKAIRILEHKSNIWLEYLPEYNISALEDVIEEHVLNHGIRHVFFDYIHSTTGLISEFQDRAKAHMAIREDQVLLELSTKLKQLCRDYDISMNAATQVNGNFKDDSNRDQTIVAGSKAIVNKADNALIAMPPSQKELYKIQPILDVMGETRQPNLIYSVYKARDSKWNKVKIWLYVDYATMRIHDLFVTDDSYQPISEIEKTYINIEGDEIASTKKTYYSPDEDNVNVVDVF